MYIGVHAKCSLFLADFNETGILSTEFRKILNIKFHENTFNGSRVVTYGQTDMTKVTVAFRNFVQAITSQCGAHCSTYVPNFFSFIPRN